MNPNRREYDLCSKEYDMKNVKHIGNTYRTSCQQERKEQPRPGGIASRAARLVDSFLDDV